MSKYIKSNEDLNKIIYLGETEESLYLDFKRTLNKEKSNSAEECALDIAQFANSYGGVIVFGVIEQFLESRKKKVATEYVDVDYEDISKYINNKVRKLLYPESIDIDVLSVLTNCGSSLVVVNVYPLLSGLACVGRKVEPYIMKYPYRTNYGKKYFNPHEVEKYISSGNRMIYVRLDEFEVRGKLIELYPDLIIESIDSNLKWDIKDPNVSIIDYNLTELTLAVGGVKINVPTGLVKEVWNTTKNSIGMILDMELVLMSDRKNVKIRMRS